MKVKARYENGILIPDKRLFPKQSTLTIEVADEDLEPEAVVSEPAPAPKTEWTESELKTFKQFPGLRKAWEILRSPPPEIHEAGELTDRQKAMWEAHELRESERSRRGRPD